jgi:hypothetical protein
MTDDTGNGEAETDAQGTEGVPRPEVLAGPTSGRLPAGTGDATGAEGMPDPRNQKSGPGQKGYGPGGPQIGSSDAPLTEVDVSALEQALTELKNLREGMEQADHTPTIIRK